MGLSKEMFRPTEAGVAFSNANRGSSEIKVSKLPARETRSESKIAELLGLILDEKDKVEHAEEPQLKRGDGFESFVNPKPQENELFINSYNGNFATKMELNRKGIERVLGIAHLEGQVFLVNLPLSRQRSAEAQGNELVAKKFRFFGEEKEKAEEENPYRKVVSIPEGWRIEINNSKIVEDLNNKNLTGEKLQKTFIKKFNQLLNKSLFECIRKEKLSSIKDKFFGRKAFGVIFRQTLLLSLFARPLSQLDPLAITLVTSLFFASNIFINSADLYFQKRQDIVRKLDAPWEYFMPYVEIDKVARSFVFLSLKGRTLVKETKQEKK